ncbi:hypothetical protein HZA99_04580, partial [Candidatus Woesearchaeota archaeon]|nr:hypothetical protein [Candidatus Woesearchaeota archaeon]
LRTWILPCLLQSLRQNKNYEYPQKFFEIGGIFTKDLSHHSLAQEAQHLGIVLTHQKASFTEARQALDYLFRMLELQFVVCEDTLGCFLLGRMGTVFVKDNDKEISVGFIGEVHPQTLQTFGLEMPVAAVEIDMTKLWEIVRGRLK